MVGGTGSNQTAKARSTAQAFSFNASTNVLSAGGLIVNKQGSLGTTVGSAISVSEFIHNNGNNSYLRIKATRSSDGTSWTTASTKLLQVIDVTEMGYVEYNPNGANFGMAFGQGSTEWARFLSDGKLGIGVTNPSVSLQVNGGIIARGGAPGANGINNNGYAFNSPGDNDSGMFSSADGQLEFYSNSAEIVRFASGGNVGVGTVTPAQKLDVRGNILIGAQVSGSVATPPYLSLGANYTNTVLRANCKIRLFENGTDIYGFGIGSAGDVQYHSVTTHQFYNSDVATFTVNSTGATSTGIVQGTRFTSTVATGTAPLTVSSTTLVTNLNADLLDGISSASFAQLTSNNSFTGSNTFSGVDNPITVYSNNATFDVWSGGLEIREVNVVGNSITTNTYAPAITFHWGNVAATAIKMYNDGSIRFKSQNTTETSYRPIYADQFISNVATGTAPLTVSSTTLVTNLNADLLDGENLVDNASTANTVVGRDASANVIANDFNSTSDIKLKTNIKTLPNSLDKVLQMRGVEFDRIDIEGKHQIGFIAQEIEKIVPELVSENQGTKSVAYGNITAILVEAIKEQQTQINNLRIELNELKK